MPVTVAASEKRYKILIFTFEVVIGELNTLAPFPQPYCLKRLKEHAIHDAGCFWQRKEERSQALWQTVDPRCSALLKHPVQSSSKNK